MKKRPLLKACQGTPNYYCNKLLELSDLASTRKEAEELMVKKVVDVTHGLCNECYKIYMRELELLPNQR